LENHHEIPFRRGVYFNRAVSACEAISDNDIVLLRPNIGTDARDAMTVVGKSVKTNIGEGQALYPELMEEPNK